MYAISGLLIVCMLTLLGMSSCVEGIPRFVLVMLALFFGWLAYVAARKGYKESHEER